MKQRIYPFAPNAPFLYPLKTSEIIRKGALGTNGLITSKKVFLFSNAYRNAERNAITKDLFELAP